MPHLHSLNGAKLFGVEGNISGQTIYEESRCDRTGCRLTTRGRPSVRYRTLYCGGRRVGLWLARPRKFSPQPHVTYMHMHQTANLTWYEEFERCCSYARARGQQDPRAIAITISTPFERSPVSAIVHEATMVKLQTRAAREKKKRKQVRGEPRAGGSPRWVPIDWIEQPLGLLYPHHEASATSKQESIL